MRKETKGFLYAVLNHFQTIIHSDNTILSSGLSRWWISPSIRQTTRQQQNELQLEVVSPTSSPASDNRKTERSSLLAIF